MEDTRLKLSGSWAALMLIYLLGDVLRIFSGDFQAGQVGDMEASQGMYLGLAVLLAIPAIMVYLSLTLKHRSNRWANIILPVFFFLFNLVGLPTYPSAYDKFLIVLGLALNVVTLWHAWKWRKKDG
jgi:hypothetical protein